MIGSTRYVAAAEIARQTQLSADISKLQQSISSTKRLTAPSDDAAASSRIGEIRQTQADQAIWSRNVATGQAIASFADRTLDTAGTLLQRAKELVLLGGNQTNTASDRAIYAQELKGIADDLDSLALTKDPNGNPLFPAATPTAIPVSETSRLPATASRTEVFDTVAVASGTKSLSGLLRDAAGSLTAKDSFAMVDAGGAPVLDTAGQPVTSTRAAAITRSIADLDAATEHLTAVQTDQGLRARRFDDAKDALANAGTDLKVERSGLEYTDLTYAATAFKAKQLALDAAQAVYAQAHKSTLFDLLG